MIVPFYREENYLQNSTISFSKYISENTFLNS